METNWLLESLKNLDQPIAKIMATHNKAIAAKFSSDDMEGLVPCLFLSLGSKVMLTRNLWTETGLVNGSLGTIQKILYQEGQSPPSLPVVKYHQLRSNISVFQYF